MSRDGGIQALLEKQTAIEAVTRLFVKTDERDWPAVRACFADEVLFDMSSAGAGPARRLSPDAIVAGWEQALRPILAIHHQTGNHLAEVSDGRARVSCYGVAYHYLPNRTGQNTRAFVGNYDFDLEKGSSGWKITTFRFHLKFLEGNRELEKAEPEDEP